MAFTYDMVGGKFQNVKVDGKPVMKSYSNALAKAQETVFWENVGAGMAYNPFGGGGCDLDTLQRSIYVWVMRWQRYSTYPTAISTFDGMRYLFNALDNEAYMNLLD